MSGRWKPVRRGICAACRRPVAVKKDGNLRHHRPHLGSGPDYYRCVGSDSLPLDARNDPHGSDGAPA